MTPTSGVTPVRVSTRAVATPPRSVHRAFASLTSAGGDLKPIPRGRERKRETQRETEKRSALARARSCPHSDRAMRGEP
ncbi:hypothetical protein KIPB_012348, partial [Kipferlia bialata]|eukprot:g12348.t1